MNFFKINYLLYDLWYKHLVNIFYIYYPVLPVKIGEVITKWFPVAANNSSYRHKKKAQRLMIH